ncbi:hypothetical protein [Roseivivax marinus]|nr:hypothetical protein [Roseivivax marinus]
MAALALTTNRSMNPGDLAEEKTAPAERLETIEKLYPHSGGQSRAAETA